MKKTSKTPTEKQVGWLNKKEMSASCGISAQAFDNWGIISVGKIGRETFFTAESVIKNRLTKERGKAPAKTNFGDMDPESKLDAIRVEKMIEETHRLRLQNNVLEGKSIPAWVITEVLTKVLSASAVTLDSIALGVRRKYPEIDQRIIDGIDAVIIEHMNEVANMDKYLDEIVDGVISEAEARIN